MAMNAAIVGSVGVVVILAQALTRATSSSNIPSVYPKCNFFTAGSISLSPVYLWLSDLHRPVYVPLGHLLLFSEEISQDTEVGDSRPDQSQQKCNRLGGVRHGFVTSAKKIFGSPPRQAVSRTVHEVGGGLEYIQTPFGQSRLDVTLLPCSLYTPLPYRRNPSEKLVWSSSGVR